MKLRFKDYRLISEAPEDEEALGDEGNINFDLEDQDLPNEGDLNDSPAAAQSGKINTPQDLDLLAIALNAISYTGNINPKVYSAFESKKTGEDKILNYVESLVGYPELDEDVILGILSGGEELDFDPSPIINKPISERLKFYNSEVVEYPDEQIRFWTRIILNCLKYDGDDYDVTIGSLDETTADSIYDKIKQDFNYNSEGILQDITKDRSTGANIRGPGVF